MVSPRGLVTKPLIPAIWTSWNQDPRAPASIKEKTGLSSDKVLGTNFSISDFAFVQTSMILPVFSYGESRPFF